MEKIHISTSKLSSLIKSATEEQILSAIDVLKKEGYKSNRESDCYFVICNGEQYPLKETIRVLNDDILNNSLKLGDTNKYYFLPYETLKVWNKLFADFKTVKAINTKDKDKKTNVINNHQSNKGTKMNDKPALNQILYGPPGTGKTYNTIIEAMKIIDKDIIKYDNNDNCKNYSDVKDKFDKLKDEGQIQFVTFHQSYSYEEFIEGIKPKTENGQITYEVQDGIFKKMCDNAQKQVIDNFDEVYEQFINEVIEYEDENSKPFTLKTSKNRIFGMRVNSNNNLTLLMGENLSPYGTLTKENLKNLADWKYYAAPIKEYLAKKYDLKYKQIENSNNKPYVLIIDEINRGNISKIFGELITLIEDDKRLGNDNKLMVQLPYSQKPFGVPKNLYIIGTMNTSDRSIALLDTALRRRFDFIEMPPKPELLKDKKVEGVDINFEKLLNEINSQIDDKDRKIGHSYLIDIKNENDLKRAFKNKIIPLLEEYYYNDKEQINSILTCGDEIKKAMEIVNK